jgi:hypothetical protein
MLLLLAGLSFTCPAWATPYIATDEEPRIRRTELHIGMLAGSSDIGDVHGPGVGLEVNAGVRLSDLTILGQFDYLGVGESRFIDAPRRGDLMRLGLAARYALFQMDPRDKPLALGFWLEAGGGRQRIAWERGGTLTRNDLVLGLGVQLDAKVGGNSGKPRYLGPYFGFRASMAGAPEPMDPAGTPTCGGPCDTATHPSATDISIFFNFGMHWGR